MLFNQLVINSFDINLASTFMGLPQKKSHGKSTHIFLIIIKTTWKAARKCLEEFELITDINKKSA